jgi:DNA-binding response OmpR family regulator
MFEVIILNPELPAEDGLCLLQRWRSNGLPTPVLVLTARSGVAEKVRALNLGADDFLEMPFDLDDLLGRLRILGKLLQRRLPKDLRKEQLPCGKSRALF